MKAPQLGLPTYNCPHCGALAQQTWAQLAYRPFGQTSKPLLDVDRLARAKFDVMSVSAKSKLTLVPITPGAGLGIDHLNMSTCTACGGAAIWFYSRMIFPADVSAPKASPDLPAAADRDYQEAATVFPYSARAAAALLRLALEKLCADLLDKPGGKINDMIAEFVKLAVPPQVVKAMDILRVSGNNAVHPGTMDHVDDQGTALSLFGLINLIVDVLITQPKHVDQLYAGLPPGARDAIEARNAKALPSPRETSPPEPPLPDPTAPGSAEEK